MALRLPAALPGTPVSSSCLPVLGGVRSNLAMWPPTNGRTSCGMALFAYACSKRYRVCRRYFSTRRSRICSGKAATALSAAAEGVSLSDILVEADSPTKGSAHPSASTVGQSLAEGQVLVHIVKVALTSNTLTYAMAGHIPQVCYFDNFPVPEHIEDAQMYARCPAWGVGVVVKSRSPAVEVGLRIYGFFTLSPYVVLSPVDITESQFVDGASHRAHIIPSYKTYRTAKDAFFVGITTPDEEDYRVAERGLFSTGWSLAQSAMVSPSGATAMIITSASSRTGYSAAFAAKYHESSLVVIGLTSERNADFTRSLGFYDIVCTYDEVPSLARQKVCVFDVAGNAFVMEAVYKHFQVDVVSAAGVGMTHVGANPLGAAGGVETYGGAQMSPFLVFTAFEALNKVHGAEKVQTMLAQATAAYRAKMLPNFQVSRHYGADETVRVFMDMAEGATTPGPLHVCSLWPEEWHDPSTDSL